MMKIKFLNRIFSDSHTFFILGASKGVDGNWSKWGDWTDCSTICGPGTNTRTRSCSNPKPSGTGLPCKGEKSEDGLCEKDPCGGEFKTTLYN